MNNLLESLNAPQREAVLYFDGPLLVLAGAGSGKTRVLTHKIAYMAAENMVAPENILAVTFTNKAAGEMKERVAHLCGQKKFPWVGTFHSICVRILRAHGSHIGVPNTYTIYDRDDQLGLVKNILKQMKSDEDDESTPSNVLARISKAKSRLQTPEDAARLAAGLDDELVAQVYQEYQKRLDESSALDFDDLLMKAVHLFRDVPEVLERYRSKFQYVLIDEYQDVNYAQHMLTLQLAKHSGNITVVGDEDQSIYAFRGADVELIMRFDKDFPGAKIVKLEQNYRSTGNILEVANQVIRQNLNRHEKTLWTEQEKGEKPVFRRLLDGPSEARFVVREIRRHYREWRRPWSDFAILYRTNAQSRLFEEALNREPIPYKLVGGTRFFERKEIKDLMGYLWVIVNPHDEMNLKRIVNVPPRGIGVATLHRLEENAAKDKKSLYQIMQDPSRVGDLTPKALAAIREVVSLITKMQAESEKLPVSKVLKKIIDGTGFEDYLEGDGSAEARGRVQNVEELVNMAAEFEERSDEPTLKNFLAEKALVADVDSWDEKQTSVTLMTLHAAKGLEFPVVFLAGLEEDTFPSARCRDNPDEMEEERRLCYVGMTRAREHLYLSSAATRRVYGEEMERIVSSFVRDLPEGLLQVQETEPWEEEEVLPMRSSFARPTVPQYSGYRPLQARPSKPEPVTRYTPATRSTGTSRSSTPANVYRSLAHGTTSAPAAPRPAPPPPPFKAGDRVKHKVFGVGVVEKMDKEVVQAEFPGHGKKNIMASFLTRAAEDS